MAMISSGKSFVVSILTPLKIKEICIHTYVPTSIYGYMPSHKHSKKPYVRRNIYITGVDLIFKVQRCANREQKRHTESIPSPSFSFCLRLCFRSQFLHLQRVASSSRNIVLYLLKQGRVFALHFPSCYTPWWSGKKMFNRSLTGYGKSRAFFSYSKTSYKPMVLT